MLEDQLTSKYWIGFCLLFGFLFLLAFLYFHHTCKKIKEQQQLLSDRQSELAQQSRTECLPDMMQNVLQQSEMLQKIEGQHEETQRRTFELERQAAELQKQLDDLKAIHERYNLKRQQMLRIQDSSAEASPEAPHFSGDNAKASSSLSSLNHLYFGEELPSLSAKKTTTSGVAKPNVQQDGSSSDEEDLAHHMTLPTSLATRRNSFLNVNTSQSNNRPYLRQRMNQQGQPQQQPQPQPQQQQQQQQQQQIQLEQPTAEKSNEVCLPKNKRKSSPPLILNPLEEVERRKAKWQRFNSSMSFV